MTGKQIKRFLSICLTGAVVISAAGVYQTPVRAAKGADQLSIKEAEIKQLLTGNLTLPDSITGSEAEITYSVDEKDKKYVTLDENVLKITRPYAGEGNYTFVLKAEVDLDGDKSEKEFSLTIAEGVSSDTYAGYVYACFGSVDGYDVQQLHLFLSEDGLNWTALNGFRPIFETGKDYTKLIENAGTHNYRVKSGTDISATVSGDASVLFPFEGDDQGIRDPYIIRGRRESDSDKIWILATDLNTMASKYGGNLDSHTVGNWGTMSQKGSTKLFIYETEDLINWERTYVDVGSEVSAGAAWAPEAIYNPDKDNYLVYWSCRSATDGYARNRLYCNETTDFKTFGPTKIYEEEAFYQKWGELISGNDGYGNIDTSQLWAVDESGNPYGTLYRLVKDETDNHIQLMSAENVLDPDVDYDNTDPNRITPYTKETKTYTSLADLTGLNDYEKAEVVYNWFETESTGNHFTYIEQTEMEKMTGAYEGATMFKFNDRDEWCVMIDYYGNNSVRYEPYVTSDLSEPNSITKVASGYGRNGGDVGCHGGMIPVTADEYNRLIDTYNADSKVENYHEIDYIGVDKRELDDILSQIEEQLKDDDLAEEEKEILEEKKTIAEALKEDPTASSDQITQLAEEIRSMLNPEELTVSKESISLSVGAEESVEIIKAPEGVPITWTSGDETVAVVQDGKIKGIAKGTTFVFVKAEKRAMAIIQVSVN